MSRTVAALRLELTPSPRLAVVLLGLHAAGAAAVTTVLPWAAAAVLAGGLVTLGVAAAWRCALLRSTSAVRAIAIEAETIDLTLGNGDRVPAQAAARRYVCPWFVTLPVVCPGHRPRTRVLLVTPDMLDAESFRRLRIWALWGRLPVAATQLPA